LIKGEENDLDILFFVRFPPALTDIVVRGSLIPDIIVNLEIVIELSAPLSPGACIDKENVLESFSTIILPLLDLSLELNFLKWSIISIPWTK
jgi:hypothetical protein